MKAKRPLLVALLAYWIMCYSLLIVAMKLTNGHFGYPLDDTYIHMAISRHFVNNGIWGVSLNSFSSSTSSPLWTALISLSFAAFGVRDWLPLLMTFLIGNCTIALCYLILSRKYSSMNLSFVLISIVVLTPLPILTLIGMEHILHGFLSLLLSYISAINLYTQDPNSKRIYLILILSAIIPIIRYEGIFLLFSIALLFIFHKKNRQAAMVLFSGAIPVTLYGLFSALNGWKFLPNSILLKGYSPDVSIDGSIDFIYHFFVNLRSSPQLVMIIIAFILILVWPPTREAIKKQELSLIVIFLVSSLLHSQFSSFGWFFRYEAYLILMGSVFSIDILGSFIRNQQPQVFKNNIARITLFCLGFLLIFPLLNRAKTAFIEYPHAVKNIFEQQYQIGIFLSNYYSNKSIAANDIGAINYLADIETLDLWGIANLEVLESRQKNRYTSDTVNDLVDSNKVELIILDAETFKTLLPSDWIEVGKWQITDNVINSNSTVTFFAPDFSQKQSAVFYLQEFSHRLPKSIIQTGLYCDQ